MADVPKTIYRVGVETLKVKHDEMERHIHDAMEKADEFKDIVDSYEDSTAWQTRFESLLMAVRDLGRDNAELQSVATELCRDVPRDSLTFGLHQSP